MARVTRRFVTLMELLIVIGILALAGGAATFGITRAKFDQQFRNEVGLLVDKLRLAQDLMLILGTDVRVVVSAQKGEKNQEGIKVELELETKISPGIEREIHRKPLILKAIKGFNFESKESEPGKIVIKFQSRGAVMSSGLIQLASAEGVPPPAGSLVNYICLAGYPRHIYSEEESEGIKEKCNKLVDDGSDTELTQDTFSKLADLMKADKEADEKNEEKNKAKEGQKPSNPKKGSSAKPPGGK